MLHVCYEQNRLRYMPRDIDVERRLADIAAATVRVAHTSGAHAVTIRSVAKQLGGSTTLVTNYVPTRARLIINALDHAQRQWDSELADLAALPPDQRLAALIHWEITQSDDEAVLRALILEAVANSLVEPDTREALRKASAQYRALLTEAARDAGYTNPTQVVDSVLLMMRGAYIVTAEDPQTWSEQRVDETIRAVLSLLSREPATAL